MLSKFTNEEIKDIFQWDVRNWKNALPFWSAHFDIKPGMKVLALGEREGGLSFAFARLDCEVTCTDYDDFPDETKKMHERYGVKVDYAKVDMRNIQFEDGEFDIVVFKSVLGAITDKEEQDKCFQEIFRVLKPGGALLFAENLKASKLHVKLRKKFVQWADRWRYPSLDEFEDWSEPFTKAYFKTHGFAGAFGRNESQRQKLSGMDEFYISVIPKSWQYIYFGVFVK